MLRLRHAWLAGALAPLATAALAGDAPPAPLVHRAPFEVVEGGADCGEAYKVKLRTELRSRDVDTLISGAPEPVDICYRTERRGSEVNRLQMPCDATLPADFIQSVRELERSLKESDVFIDIAGELCASPWAQSGRVLSGSVSIKNEIGEWDIPVLPEHSTLRVTSESNFRLPVAMRGEPRLSISINCVPIKWSDQERGPHYARLNATFLLHEHPLETCSTESCFGATQERYDPKFDLRYDSQEDCTKPAAPAD